MKYLGMMLAAVIFFAACKNTDDKKTDETAPVTAEKAPYSEGFNASFGKLLNGYFALKDAFIEGDTSAVNAKGVELKTIIDSLQLTELQQKDSLAFESINGRPGDVSAEITGMLGESTIQKKRESFEMISNALYDIVRAVRPANQPIYYLFCPAAFDNKGAYWLSNTEAPQNPYADKKEAPCGEVKETLKY